VRESSKEERGEREEREEMKGRERGGMKGDSADVSMRDGYSTLQVVCDVRVWGGGGGEEGRGQEGEGGGR
jgi:hypothetical protein